MSLFLNIAASEILLEPKSDLVPPLCRPTLSFQSFQSHSEYHLSFVTCLTSSFSLLLTLLSYTDPPAVPKICQLHGDMLSPPGFVPVLPFTWNCIPLMNIIYSMATPMPPLLSGLYSKFTFPERPSRAILSKISTSHPHRSVLCPCIIFPLCGTCHN